MVCLIILIAVLVAGYPFNRIFSDPILQTALELGSLSITALLCVWDSILFLA